MKVQYISDIHLEARKEKQNNVIINNIIKYGIDNECDILVVAGDLSPSDFKRREFFKKMLEGRWQKIFYVPGNHEYWDTKRYHTFDEIEEKLLKIDEIDQRVHVLIRDKIEIIFSETKYLFIGCTLWGDLQPCDKHKIRDFQFIMKKTGLEHPRRRAVPISYQDYIDMHKTDELFLINNIPEDYDGKICVITHHCPSKIPMLFDTDLHAPSAYYCDLDMLFSNCDLWIYGHTHIPFYKTIDRGFSSEIKMVLCSSPLGYMQSSEKCGNSIEL